MKKYYFAFAAAMLAATSFAQSPKDGQKLFSGNSLSLNGQKEVVMPKNAQSNIVFKDINNPESKTVLPLFKKAAAKVDFPTTLITETPEGTLYKDMWRSFYGYYVYWFWAVLAEEDALGGDLVEGADGSFYIKNPFGGYATNTWIKGEKGEGDTINVQLPQAIYDYGEGVYLYAMNMKDSTYYDEDGNLSSTFVPAESQVVKYVWHDKTLTKTDDTHLIGMVDVDGGWYGYGDYTSVWTEQTDPKSTPADTTGTQPYTMQYGGDFQFVDVKFDGSDVYVKGVSSTQPDAWIKGTIKGDSAYFDMQYFGVDPEYNYHTYFIPAIPVQVYDEEYEEYYDSYEIKDGALAFAYDAEAKTLATDGLFLINGGKSRVYYISAIDSAVFAPYTEVAAIPADPTITDFMAYDEEYGYGGVAFDAPKVGTKGEVLNPANMYYNMYFDDELFTLFSDEYPGIEDEMTDIPYDFYDYVNYDISCSGTSHTFYFYTTGFDRIGVQMFYTGGGETNSSNIVYYDVTATGIKSAVKSGDNAVKTVTYTDLGGRTVKNPTSGLYLKTMTFADGTVKTVKVVKK